MTKWGPQDVIALVLIVGGLALRFSGIDGAVGTSLVVVSCLYYGIDLTSFIKLGRRQKHQEEG